MEALPLARSRIPPATQATVYHKNGPARADGKDTDNLNHRKKLILRNVHKLKNVNFNSKKGLNIDFKVTRDGKNVHFT